MLKRLIIKTVPQSFERFFFIHSMDGLFPSTQVLKVQLMYALTFPAIGIFLVGIYLVATTDSKSFLGLKCLCRIEYHSTHPWSSTPVNCLIDYRRTIEKSQREQRSSKTKRLSSV